MKREVKFRGKSTDTGKWVYGFLSFFYTAGRDENGLIFTDKARIYSPEDGCCYDVWAETVGQLTGLRDKNGKEIYEGDIVQLDYITTNGKHRIGLSFEVKWCTQEGCWVGWDGFVENALQQTHKMFVVKGNIYDNPNLI